MYPVLVFVHLATTSSVEIPSPSLESRLHCFVKGHHCTCRSTVIVQYPPPSLKPHSPTSSPHCRSKILGFFGCYYDFYLPICRRKRMATIERGRASWSNGNKIFIDLCIAEVQIEGKSWSHLKASLQGAHSYCHYAARKIGRVLGGILRKTITISQRDGDPTGEAAWTPAFGIGYNEHTLIVTVEPERWEEYLKANPNAKVFPHKTITVSQRDGNPIWWDHGYQ
ncbi:hypothetical protein MRB53_030858 [Persea americana]|uniref:Uncharacterized protein n=1 Tax=Persea americana TaxID=3435 RepID=A0ACC2KMG0_PERAE|nr:hypothetical protein MRB53_030858 [Persea americana]